MNSKRFFYVMIGLVALLGLAIFGSVYVGNNMLTKHSDKLSKLKLESQVADQQQILLTQAKKDIANYSELKQAAREIVPQDKDQAAVVREIVKIAKDNGIKLGAITFPASTLGQRAAPTSSTEGSAKATPSPTSASKAPPVTQVQAVPGISGVFVMPITVKSDADTKVSYNAFLNFLGSLESNRRTAQVSSINIIPDKQNNTSLSFNLVLNAYIKP